MMNKKKRVYKIRIGIPSCLSWSGQSFSESSTIELDVEEIALCLK